MGPRVRVDHHGVHAWVCAALLAATGVCSVARPALAHVTRVPATSGAAAAAAAAAMPGDTLLLERGVHAGPLLLRQPVVLRGAPGAIVDGGHHGSVIAIGASGCVVTDLRVRASGNRVLTVDSGIHVAGAGSVRIERVRMDDVLYAVYGERAEGLIVRQCRLSGRVPPLAELGDGNGIHLWYSGNALIDQDTLSGFVDAVYLSFANGAVVSGSTFERNGRYGLHTMYCQDNHLIGNLFTHNIAGIAIMFSNHLEVAGNRIVHNRGSRTYGLLLRDCSDGHFVNNQLIDNTIAVFLDGSNRNHITGNLVEDNGWGVLLFSSCDGNVFAGNDFIQNDYAVALDMRRTDNAFDDGAHGNYWSDAQVWDLDGYGTGDIPYGPVSAFAFVSKQYPDLSVLAKSPAVAALGVAERVFPSLHPSEAVDRYPRVSPVTRAVKNANSLPTPRPSWGAFTVFGLVAGSGLFAARGGRRPRNGVVARPRTDASS